METVIKRLYEAMFLVDSAQAAADWDGIIKTIKTILEKAEAEVISIRKWDERRLAYEINHKDRGTYILCYFRSNGEKIDNIERDVRLSEQIVRVLILNAEHMSAEDIEKDTPATFAKKAAEEAAAKAAQKAEVREERLAENREQDEIDKQVKIDALADFVPETDEIVPEANEVESGKEEPEQL